MKAYYDRTTLTEMPLNDPITFAYNGIRLEGKCIIKLFYYSETGAPLGPYYYPTTFGEQLQYALNEPGVIALQHAYVNHNSTRYAFNYWVDATTHVPLGAGNIPRTDMTQRVYGDGLVIQLSTLYNQG